jgi:acetyltransferase-like isoleucine patch superfamily enzyme
MRNYDMKFVAIDFGQDPKPKLFPLGITIHNLRGVRHFSENTAFEPPCHSHAEIHNWCEVRIGAFSHFNAGRIGDVHIGRYSAVGADAVIGMHEHPTDWLSTSRLMYQPELHDFRITAGAHDLQALQSKKRTFTEFSKVTTIGNDVLVGQGVYFKGGVTVGDGAVIGARSVVVKDVPPYAIVAGSPAKVKRYRFPDRIIERLLALKWWRFSLFDFYGVESHLDGEFIYAGPIYHHFGHFMAEMVHRIVQSKKLFSSGNWIFSDIAANDQKTYDYLPSWIKAILEFVEVESRSVTIIGKNTAVSRVSVVEQGSDFGGGPKPGYLSDLLEFSERRLQTLRHSDAPIPKVYVSRGGVRHGGAFLGESYIENHLEREGFFIFRPEQYTPSKQMDVYRKALHRQSGQDRRLHRQHPFRVASCKDTPSPALCRMDDPGRQHRCRPRATGRQRRTAEARRWQRRCADRRPVVLGHTDDRASAGLPPRRGPQVFKEGSPLCQMT